PGRWASRPARRHHRTCRAARRTDRAEAEGELSAIAARVAAEHQFEWVAKPGSIGDEVAAGCTCDLTKPLDHFPAHLIEVTEAATREQIAADIEAERAAYEGRYDDFSRDPYGRGVLFGESVAAQIARGVS